MANKNSLKQRRRCFENLERRHCLSAIGFVDQETLWTDDIVHALSAEGLDGDGDLDLVYASGHYFTTGQVAWYENDGEGNFDPEQRVISDTGATWLSVEDVDGDGDLDVLSASSYQHRSFRWHENVDGQGNFGDPKAIVDSRYSPFAGDINGDGSVDVVTVEGEDLGRPKLGWRENIDGRGMFGEPTVIELEQGVLPGFDASIFAGDVDGDGDLDVLSSVYNDGEGGFESSITWFENTDGHGVFNQRQVFSAGERGERGAILAGDIDGDGDLDVLSTSYPSEIVWFENIDSRGNFGERRGVTDKATGLSTDYTSSSNIVLDDFDGDGDLDVLSASRDTGIIAWYENVDGRGAFADRIVTKTKWLRASCVIAADLDGDGDLDAAYGENHFPGRISWSQSRPIGDSNNDGRFDSSDLVKVFQINEYEDIQRRNSTFEDGDWNGDGDFDSSDLVLAFRCGTYVASAAPEVEVMQSLFNSIDDHRSKLRVIDPVLADDVFALHVSVGKHGMAFVV